MRGVIKFLYFKFFKWKLLGAFPSDIPKYIVIGAPHTSWLDFPLGLALRSISKKNIRFIGKKSLFQFPLGFFMRKLGGFPVDRTRSANMVEYLINLFKTNEAFILALSPEGTRQKVDTWKTGFYYTAKGAEVPVVKVAFDFKNRQVIIDEPYYLTDSKDEDFEKITRFYKGVLGRHAHLS